MHEENEPGINLSIAYSRVGYHTGKLFLHLEGYEVGHIKYQSPVLLPLLIVCSATKFSNTAHGVKIPG